MKNSFIFVCALAAIGLFALAAVSALAQSAAAPPSSPPAASFDVVDVHASSFARYQNTDGGNLMGDRYVLYQATMTQIIAAAYNLDPAYVQGGPSWLDWDRHRFDIIAKAPPKTSKETIRLMLQSLLAERFSLVVHKGTAPMPAYVLSAPVGKARLKESADTDNPGCKGQVLSANPSPGVIPQIMFSCHGETMTKFADDLHSWGGGYLGYIAKPVIDSTGLKGAYDFDLKWTPSGLMERAGADGITIFDAVDKQLGLKLVLQNSSQPVLIVDSVNETPTPNPSDLAQRMPPLPPPAFEVATIKPAKPDEKGGFWGFRGDQVSVQNMTLKALINSAWDLDPYDQELLVGAPKWLDEDHIDILAKLSTDDSGGAAPKAPQFVFQEVRQMMRTLIEERFQMKYHWENRPVTAYRLVAFSPKLTPADPKARTRCDEGPGPDGKDPRLANPALNRLVTCQNMTMEQLSVELQSFAGGFIYRTVLDDTGLKGSYNFTLSFSGIDHFLGGVPPPDGAQQAADPNGATTLFDALRNQLGLKLEKEKRALPVLVIDHIEEQPTAN